MMTFHLSHKESETCGLKIKNHNNMKIKKFN
jgi:hypothetical protein